MTERDIFLALLDLPDRADRAAYLREACGGDEVLRGRVEALLRSHDHAGSFLNRPAVDPGHPTDEEVPLDVAMPPDYDASIKPGAVLAGRYTLVEKIGEGGMGEVWVAKQTEPLKRKVALKLIKAGMDSRQVIARFDAERQALALMDHPNIARVLDGGLTEDRRPFFVMELVNGLPLTRFCDDARLTPRARLGLFVPVCQAVQHAHQKGIVHRDLKPSNILVTLYDGQPVPKVIDFGVAKPTGGKLTDESLSTHFGAVVGTFEYMAPEQAALSAVDVDTRADVYSLGVILYELLTGLKPFDSQRLRRAALDEVIRILREEEPSRPSTRLSTDESLPAAAARRQTEPRKLKALMQGELDWVVMKCLEKQRDRRYETAASLARDLQRYLGDQPVEARPPSARYRLGKFLRRNRGPVLAAAAVLGAAALGTGAAASQAIRAIRAEAAAARTEAEAKEKARRDAEEKFTLAKEAVGRYLFRVTDDPRLKEKDFFDLRKKLLETAVPFYEKFAAMKSGDQVQEAVRGRAYGNLANIREQMGEQEAARAVFEKLAADFPTVPTYREELAIACNNLGVVLKALGRYSEAEAAIRQALDIRKKLAADFPLAPRFRQGLGSCQNNLGAVLREQERHAEAEAAFRASLGIRKKLAADFPGVPENQRDLARTYSNLGWQGLILGKHAEAEEAFRAALSLREKLAGSTPGAREHRQERNSSRRQLGHLLMAPGKHAEAEALFRQALEAQQKLAGDFPSVPESRQELGAIHNSLGQVLAARGKHAEAEAAFRQALEARQKLAADFPAVPQYRWELSDTHDGLGQLLQDTGRHAEAEAAFRQALALSERLVADFPGVPGYRHGLGASHNGLGQALRASGRHAEAEAALRRALAFREKLAADSPSLPANAVDLAGTQVNFGLLVRDRGEPAAALEWFARAIARLRAVLEQEPRLAQARLFLRNAHWGRATALGSLGRHAESASEWGRALAVNDEGAREAWFRVQMALSLARAGRFAEAAAAVQALREPARADAGALYDAACVYSLLAGAAKDEQSQAEKHAARAVALLRRAVEGGYDNLAQLKSAPDLAALRQRQDFRAILGDLEKGNATRRRK